MNYNFTNSAGTYCSAGTYWRNKGGSYGANDLKGLRALNWDLDNPSRYTERMGFRTAIAGRMPR